LCRDGLARDELKCEADALKTGGSVVDCRTWTFTFNQFLRRHQKDFVLDWKNMLMMADAAEKLGDNAPISEESLETAFRMIDKKKLDKKVYLDRGDTGNRQEW
jgi:NADPH:quinone reductase-like Zn-dependent oxidoreductase